MQGIHSLEALKTVDQGNLKNKILVDLTNPYIYEDGHISLDSKYTNTTCLGEEVQKLIPNTKVVKTLDYIGSIMMTNPNRLSEAVTGFYCGNDEEAKKEIKELLKDFGWNETFDLGDISMSRYLEMLGAFWVPVFNQFGTMQWGLKLIKD